MGERTYPVIRAVNASHVIVEVGDMRTVSIGDVTLVGPEDPDVYPNDVARVSRRSVHDPFMHLNPQLPSIGLWGTPVVAASVSPAMW